MSLWLCGPLHVVTELWTIFVFATASYNLRRSSLHQLHHCLAASIVPSMGLCSTATALYIGVKYILSGSSLNSGTTVWWRRHVGCKTFFTVIIASACAPICRRLKSCVQWFHWSVRSHHSTEDATCRHQVYFLHTLLANYCKISRGAVYLPVWSSQSTLVCSVHHCRLPCMFRQTAISSGRQGLKMSRRHCISFRGSVSWPSQQWYIIVIRNALLQHFSIFWACAFLGGSLNRGCNGAQWSLERSDAVLVTRHPLLTRPIVDSLYMCCSSCLRVSVLDWWRVAHLLDWWSYTLYLHKCAAKEAHWVVSTLFFMLGKA